MVEGGAKIILGLLYSLHTTTEYHSDGRSVANSCIDHMQALHTTHTHTQTHPHTRRARARPHTNNKSAFTSVRLQIVLGLPLLHLLLLLQENIKALVNIIRVILARRNHRRPSSGLCGILQEGGCARANLA